MSTLELRPTLVLIVAFALGSLLGAFLPYAQHHQNQNQNSNSKGWLDVRPPGEFVKSPLILASSSPSLPCGSSNSVNGAGDGGDLIAAPKPSSPQYLEFLLDRAANHTAKVYPEFSKLVFIAEANFGFKDMVTNFVHHAKKTSPSLLPHIVFFALDPFVHAHMLRLNITSYLDPTINFSSKAQGFRSKDYNQIVGHKFHLVLATLKRGFDVFLIDVDVAVLKNPLNYVRDLAKCDMSVTIEDFNPLRLMDLNSTTRFGGWPDFNIFINTGVLLWRNTRSSVALIEEFLRPKWRRPNSGDDQNEFNKFMLAYFDDSALSKDQVDARSFRKLRYSQCVQYGHVSMLILPPSLFPGAYQVEFRMPLVFLLLCTLLCFRF